MNDKLFVAKEATTIALSVVLSKGIEKLLITTTNLEVDGVPVRVTSAVGGWMIANHFRDQTDAGVEWAAAKVTEFRQNRKAKKDEVPQTDTP